MEPSIYDLLGVDPRVDHAALKAAYRARVRVLHPDRGGSPALYGELKTLNTLWSQVDTPARRAAYDLSRMVEQERAKLAAAAEAAAAAKRERRQAAAEEQSRAAAEEQRRQAVAQAAAEAVRRRYGPRPRPGSHPQPGSRPQPAQKPPPASPGAPPAGAAPGAPASAAPPSPGVDWKGVGEVVADVFRSFVKRR